MGEQESRPLSGWLLYITNHFTHPILEAQTASPRHHLARKLSERGQKMIVYCPLGRHIGSPARDFVSNLLPSEKVEGNTLYLFPPVLLSPASATTPIALIMGTIFIIVYLKLARVKVVAQYATTVLVATVGAVLKMTMRIPLVANYGDPDFVRERGLARRAFQFCENLVMARGNACAIVYVDEVIGEHVKSYGVRRTIFLPNGGYEEGFSRLTCGDPAVRAVEKQLELKGKKVIIYAGQLTRGYRLDVIVPAAAAVVKAIPDVVFLIIGQGSSLQALMKAVRESGMGENFRFTGAIPYDKITPYLAISGIGLQLLNDMCMGTKVLMYMANHIAVVAVGGWYSKYHEFLRNGENALLVPPDAAKLAEAIIQLLGNEDRLGAIEHEAWKTVKPYTWDKHADDTLALLWEAVAQGLRPSTFVG